MISKENLLSSRLLIVDDNPANVDLLEKTLSSEGYSSILGITDPRKASQLYSAYKPHLVLLDINMPHLDGYQVMEQFKQIEGDFYIPVLVLTALQDKQTKIRALKEGAQDFLTKPFDQIEVITRIENLLRLRMLHNEVKNQNVILEQKVQHRTIALQQRTVELHNTRLEIIRRLTQAAEYRDNETGEHIIRMSRMSSLLGNLAGMNGQDSELLLNTSPMHDIGKIGIPDHILLKPGKLTTQEWEIMARHTTIGGKLLDGHESKLMQVARDIALTHHEKWNGTGYPKGLKNSEIPLEGRVCGLVDVFDALTSRRPYKDPYPISKACEIIKIERGKHFDPDLTDLFLDNIDEFIAIKDELSETEDIAPLDYKLSERDIENGV